MPKPLAAFLLAATAVLTTVAAPAQAAGKSQAARAPAPPARSVEETLRANAQALMDAVSAGGADVWERLLDSRVTYVDEAGAVLDRKALLEGMKPLPAGVSGTIRVTDFHAVVAGDVAAATYVADEHETFHGHLLHGQYRETDTWRKTPDGWRLFAAQVLALRTDPPALAVDRDDLEEYEGRYVLAPGIAYEIRLTDGGLEGRETGKKPEPLAIEAGDVLFVPGKPRYRLVFLRDEDGMISGFAHRREAWDLVFRKER